MLVVLNRNPRGSDSLLLDPGSMAEWTPGEPLTERQLNILNSELWRDKYRVLIAPPANRAARLGLLRDALERARQHQYDGRLYYLGGRLTDALSVIYGEGGKGSASVLRLQPMWADAAARGAALAREHASLTITDDLLWGPYGALLRPAWQPGELRTLAKRLVVWAALHRSAVAALASSCGGIDKVISDYSVPLVSDWRALIEDAELTRLARMVRLSIPSSARIETAAHYPASVWDRVLDLLDRGMTHGQSLVGVT